MARVVGARYPMNQTVNSLWRCALVLCVLYSATAGIVYLYYTTTQIESEAFSGLRLAIVILLAPLLLKYLVQLVVSPFYSLIEKSRENRFKNSANPSHSPLVSVLIPAWNEEVGIIKTIRSVLASRYANFEIIVINDGSTDSTHEQISGFISEYQNNWAEFDCDAEIKYLRLPNGGKANAMNQGLKLAQGEFVVTIDADSVMHKQAINNLIKRFRDPTVAAVAGNVVIGNRHKPIELMQQLEYLYGFFFKRADSVFKSVYIIGGAAAAYRTEVLRELGGFDSEIITEDIEMSTRILSAGYKTRYAADAVVYTEGPADWKGLCDQRLRWKFGRLLTFIKHKNLFFSGKKQHNPYLTCLLLPAALYAELALLFEGLLLTVFFAYTIYFNDYLPLLLVISFLALVVTTQIALDVSARSHANLLLLAPVAWLVFYVIDIIEFQALYRSLKRFIKREELQWQRWVRVGLINQTINQTVAPAEIISETD